MHGKYIYHDLICTSTHPSNQCWLQNEIMNEFFIYIFHFKNQGSVTIITAICNLHNQGKVFTKSKTGSCFTIKRHIFLAQGLVQYSVYTWYPHFWQVFLSPLTNLMGHIYHATWLNPAMRSFKSRMIFFRLYSNGFSMFHSDLLPKIYILLSVSYSLRKMFCKHGVFFVNKYRSIIAKNKLYLTIYLR